MAPTGPFHRSARGRLTRARQGERHHLAKLTAAAVQEIRRRHAAGASVAELARDFHVTTQHIYYVVRRKCWRHLPD